jgi:hypothetical protein
MGGGWTRGRRGGGLGTLNGIAEVSQTCPGPDCSTDSLLIAAALISNLYTCRRTVDLPPSTIDLGVHHWRRRARVGA